MDEYKIVITPDAETDLNELDDYISFYLMAPDIAISCIRYIRPKQPGSEKLRNGTDLLRMNLGIPAGYAE